MSESKFEEAIKFLGRCLKEKGLNVSKIILFGSCPEEKPPNDVMLIF